MIPQRVSIEGFMSYRERVEFYFDGAPVWMLTGENGAGKSTVFDAITFALYGVHRGGKDDVEELINRGCDRMAVEFDFLLGEDRYRVRRTVSRTGGPTYQATHLSGPSAPRPAKGASQPQPVPGTHNKSGLTGWVQRRLGLDAKAFKMAVLLEQGNSEALLSAEPRERHQLLTQLVDLSRYQALAERAREQQKAARASVRVYEAQLKSLPEVTDAEIGSHERDLSAAKTQVAASQARAAQLQGLMVHAQNWDKLCRQREEVCHTLAAMNALLADAPNIERAAALADDLRHHLPLMRRILAHSKNYAQQQGNAQRYEQEAQHLAAQVSDLTPQVAAARVTVERLQQAREQAQAAERDALQQINDLASARHAIRELARLGERIAACDGALAHFDADLDQQAASARQAVDELYAVKSMLPYLEQYVGSRERWHKSTAQLEAAQRELAAHAEQVAAALAQVESAHAALNRGREAFTNAKSQAAVAQRDLAQVEAQIKRFGEVDAAPTCLYCGQALTPEHLDAERIRLAGDLASCTRAAHAADRAEAEAQALLLAAEAELQRCQSTHEQASAQHGQCRERCKSLGQERGHAEQVGAQALLNARANHAPASATGTLLPQAADLLAAFAEPLPTVAQVQSLQARGRELAAAQARQQQLQARVAERDRHLTSRQQWQAQFVPLAELYPEAARQEIQARHAAAEEARDKARTMVAQTGVELDQARAQADAQGTVLQRAQSDLQRAEQEARTAQQLALASHTQREAEIAGLSARWRERAAQVDDGRLLAWEAELASLHDAAQRLAQLAQARSRIAQAQARLAEIEGELDGVPQEARQPVAHLQQQAEQARAEQAAGEAGRERASSALRVLQERRERRSHLSSEMRAAEKREAHYGVLAKYLGRDYLQRFLLQQAEREIVERANEVLDHCSGGMLAMELRPNEEVGALQQAFDLMVENRATQSAQDKMLPAWLLSGSQRFRVAISLALGIGQFAGATGQGIESVIIDEGFGSLDRQGLRDMEEALRELSEKLALRRIILVSHQEEFARAFPHRYAITLEDGASRACLVDGLDAAL